MTTAHDKLRELATGWHDDGELIRAANAACAEWDALTADVHFLHDEVDLAYEQRKLARDERDTLANANTANVGLLRKAEAERDDWRAKYEWMVAAAADEKLDGYRELGARAAKAEAERDAYKAEADEAQRANDGLAEAVARLARERDAALAELAEVKAEIERLRKLGYKLEVGNGR